MRKLLLQDCPVKFTSGEPFLRSGTPELIELVAPQESAGETAGPAVGASAASRPELPVWFPGCQGLRDTAGNPARVEPGRRSGGQTSTKGSRAPQKRSTGGRASAEKPVERKRRWPPFEASYSGWRAR